MKKKVQKFKEDQKVFSGNEVMSMIENFSDGIGVIAEEVRSLGKKVESLKETVDEIKEDVDVMKGDVSDIKYKLDRKVSYDDFEKLEKRVLKLERQKA